MALRKANADKRLRVGRWTVTKEYVVVGKLITVDCLRRLTDFTLVQTNMAGRTDGRTDGKQSYQPKSSGYPDDLA